MRDLADYLITLALTGAMLFIAYSLYVEALTTLVEDAFKSF